MINILEQNILPILKYGIEIYGNTNTEKLNKIIKKLISIIITDKNDITKYKRKYDLKHIYKIQWIKLIHKCIYNNITVPKYYKNILNLIQNRNGLLIKIEHRKCKYSENKVKNKAHDIWNKLNKNYRQL